METAGYFVVAFSLAMVPFSVALKSSVFRCVKWTEALTMAFFFGLIPSLMFAFGFQIGLGLKSWFHQLASPVSLMLMFFLSMRMMVDARRASDAQRTIISESNKMIMGFSLVMSINPFLLGISLGMVLDQQFLAYAVIFGVVFLITLLGSRMGRRGFVQWPFFAELLGGAALLVLTVVSLLQYLKII